MTDTPLKPCPFCEGEAETDETIITDEFDEPTDAKECVVCCPECRIWFIGSTPAEAIAAWNSRPTPTSADNAQVEPVAWRYRPNHEHTWQFSDFDHGGAEPLYTQDQLDAAVRAERERCARIAAQFTVRSHLLEKDVPMWHRSKLAAAIRARGEP